MKQHTVSGHNLSLPPQPLHTAPVRPAAAVQAPTSPRSAACGSAPVPGVQISVDQNDRPPDAVPAPSCSAFLPCSSPEVTALPEDTITDVCMYACDVCMYVSMHYRYQNYPALSMSPCHLVLSVPGTLATIMARPSPLFPFCRHVS